MMRFIQCFIISLLVLPALIQAQNLNQLTQAYKSPVARPVIWIGDFNNLDDAVALMLIAKDPGYRIDLLVVEESFNTVAHSANIAYNILEWLGNLDTLVIRGAFHAVDEVQLGANGIRAADTVVNDAHSVPDQPDYQLPNSFDADTRTWNLERRNVVGINIYGQFVPGPWRDGGSTLFGTDHLIPRASQKHYHYRGNQGVAFDFRLAEEIILEHLEQIKRKAIILNTGKLTTLARTLAKGSETQLAKIRQVLIMGGGFQGLEPFTANHAAACFGDRTLNLGGNVFSHPSFNCDTDFSTHQEMNLFLDPASAKQVFDLLSTKGIAHFLIPTNATDNALIEPITIQRLAATNSTPESCYVSKLFEAISDFEGGRAALSTTIRLWDIVAALILLEPKLVTDIIASYVEVDQLDPGLAESSTPYDPISFDPMVGKTRLTQQGHGTQCQIILAIQAAAARQAMISRLRAHFNSATDGPQCH